MRLGILFLLLGFLPLPGQNAQLAGMQQDLAELRNEVEKLKLENADLRAAHALLKAGQGPSASIGEALAKSRGELLGEVDRRLKAQADAVTAALAELTRQVNAALGRTGPGSDAKPASSPAQAGTPAPSDDGMPTTGVRYRVRSGDTVTKIAQRHGSRIEWILRANNLPSAAALKADVDVFVPQPDPSGR